MSNIYDNMREFVAEGRRRNDAARLYAQEIAELLPGHLRSLSHGTLVKLKDELRNFNIKTGRWKKS